jgi:hypothetical protein
MTRPRIEIIVCSCSWSGPLSVRSQCPGCGESSNHRVSRERIDVLRQIMSGSPARMVPVTRIWLLAHRLITPASPRISPVESRRPRPPKRAWRVTERGEHVILAAARMASSHIETEMEAS